MKSQNTLEKIVIMVLNEPKYQTLAFFDFYYANCFTKTIKVFNVRGCAKE
jgi:hypothetical protein